MNVADKVNEAGRVGRPLAEDVKTLKAINTAVAFLVASFYVFVALLVESLTLDEYVEPHALLSAHRYWALPLDVCLAGGTLALGIALLVVGAKEINSLVPHAQTAKLLGPLGRGGAAPVDAPSPREGEAPLQSQDDEPSPPD